MDGFIKLQQIAENLAEHPMLRDISFDRIVHYAQEFIRIVGAPKLFLDKTAVVEINNYRGVLPCDFISIIQVRGVDRREYVATMNNFHNSDTKEPCVGTATYRIQGNVIITSEEDKDVEIAYRAIPVDEDGWPMLPDNAAFTRALEAYIKLKKFQILFDMGEITAQVFTQAQSDYTFMVAQAHNSLHRPTYDEMEVLGNMWNSFIPRKTAHRTAFAFEHNKELLKNH